MARADRFTELSHRETRYSDFLTDFDKNPVTKSLAQVTDESDIKQSLRNMILTLNGEWAFEPRLGSRIGRLLFEPGDAVTQTLIEKTVAETISRFEPRVQLIAVHAKLMVDGSSYMIIVTFTLVNIANSQTTLQLILNRAR